MPNTYSQLYVQIVFAVEGRQNLIAEENREELQKYICGIITKRGQKPLAIFCMPDHTHILVGLKPAIAISDMVRDIKTASTNFINENRWVRGKFSWQEGFGAFSYSKSHVDIVVKYILNQQAHHSKRTFKDEYLEILNRFDVDYDEKYLFEWAE